MTYRDRMKLLEGVFRKSALSQISVAELKKIGVSVIETGDQEIDRLVNALLRGNEEHQD